MSLGQVAYAQHLVLTFGLIAAAIVLIVVVSILVVRRGRKLADPDQWERLLEVAIEKAGEVQADSPNVSFTFHTYSGTLFEFVQTEHNPELRQPVALAFLWELHLYNITNCIVPYQGSLFVPFLSYINYRAQKQKILSAR